VGEVGDDLLGGAEGQALLTEERVAVAKAAARGARGEVLAELRQLVLQALVVHGLLDDVLQLPALLRRQRLQHRLHALHLLGHLGHQFVEVFGLGIWRRGRHAWP